MAWLGLVKMAWWTKWRGLTGLTSSAGWIHKHCHCLFLHNLAQIEANLSLFILQHCLSADGAVQSRCKTQGQNSYLSMKQPANLHCIMGHFKLHCFSRISINTLMHSVLTCLLLLLLPTTSSTLPALWQPGDHPWFSLNMDNTLSLKHKGYFAFKWWTFKS